MRDSAAKSALQLPVWSNKIPHSDLKCYISKFIQDSIISTLFLTESPNRTWTISSEFRMHRCALYVLHHTAHLHLAYESHFTSFRSGSQAADSLQDGNAHVHVLIHGQPVYLADLIVDHTPSMLLGCGTNCQFTYGQPQPRNFSKQLQSSVWHSIQLITMDCLGASDSLSRPTFVGATKHVAQRVLLEQKLEHIFGSVCIHLSFTCTLYKTLFTNTDLLT